MNKSITIVAGAVSVVVLIVSVLAAWIAYGAGFSSGVQSERSRAVRLKAAKYSVVVDKDADTPRFDFSYIEPVIVNQAPQVSALDEARKEITALTELMAAQDKVRQQIKAEIVPLPPPAPQPVQAPVPPIQPQVKAEPKPPVIVPEPPVVVVKESELPKSEVPKPAKFEKVVDKNPPVLDPLINKNDLENK